MSSGVVSKVVIQRAWAWDPARAASWGNAGHIATEQVEPLASAKTIRGAWGRSFRRGGALALPLGGIGEWLPFSLRLRATFCCARRHLPLATFSLRLRRDILLRS